MTPDESRLINYWVLYLPYTGKSFNYAIQHPVYTVSIVSHSSTPEIQQCGYTSMLLG